MAEGLKYLHSNGVIHGDVRGVSDMDHDSKRRRRRLTSDIAVDQSNVFISQERHVQLADFGLAAIDDVTSRGSATSEAGSKRWMAPELHDPERFGLKHFERTPATDMYAFGSTILEVRCLTRRGKPGVLRPLTR